MNTKRKNTKLVALVLALVALVAIGGTLAYLTDTDSVLNTLGLGIGDPEDPETGDKTVDIMIVEPEFDIISDNKTLYDLLPGDKVMKDPTVKNVGKGDVYIRVQILDSESAGAAPVTIETLENYYGIEINTTDWTYHAASNTFYFTKDAAANQLAIFAGKTDSDLFVKKQGDVSEFTDASGNYTIEFPTTLTNEDISATKLHIVAEAVQARNYTPGDLTTSNPFADAGAIVPAV